MAAAIALPIVSAIVSTAISYAFPSDGPRLRDTKVSASTYGNVIPEIYGTARVGGNMIWSKPFTEKKKKKRAGKGGSYYNEYTYYCDFAMAFCRGPVKEVRRIWADGKVIYDTTGGSEVIDNNKYRFRFYPGDEAQLPDSLIVEDKGADYAPAYRGLCYVVFDDFALADFGNRIPQIMAEVYAGDEGGAAITDIVPLPSSPVTGGSYQLGQMMIDADRGYFYLVDPVSNPAGTVLRRFLLANGKEDRREIVSIPQAQFPPSVYDSPELTSVRGVTSKGELLCVFGGVNNYMRIEKLDPYSWQSLGTIGRSYPFEGTPENSLEHSNTNFEISRDEKGNYLCLTLGVFGEYNIFDPSDMSFKAKGDMAGWNGPATPMYICARQGGPATSRRFYHVTYAGGASLQVCSLGEVLYNHPVEFPGNSQTATAWAFWDEGDPGVVFFYSDGPNRYIAKWSESTGVLAWKTQLRNSDPFCGYGVYGLRARIKDNEFHWVYNKHLFSINTATGQWIDRTFDQDFYKSDNDKTAEQVNDGDKGLLLPRDISEDYVIYDPRRNIVICVGQIQGQNGIVHVGGYTGGKTSVGAIVERLLVSTGQMTSNDYDLTPLYDIPVYGYGYASSTDIKSIIAELRNLFMFDLVESDGRLVARVRGDQDPDAEVPWKLLGSQSGPTPDKADYWKETRMSESDLPASIDLTYSNIDDDYNPSTAKSKRIASPVATMLSRQQVKAECNLVMDATEAKNRVNIMLYTQWEERTQHQTALPWLYANLDASDLISVTMEDGRNYFERIGSIEFGADFSSRLETYGTDSGAYLSDKTGDGGGAGRPTVVPAPKPVVGFILNTPLLRDTHDSGGNFSNWYSAIGAGAPGVFLGGTMFKSANAQDYVDLYQEPESAEWGTVMGAVPSPSHGWFALDWETRITITPAVDFFELESITDDELWEGLNLVVIGDEVLQFRDAVQNADGTWTIWNLLRGRRGTQYACDNHKAGERFVFLDERSIEFQAENLDTSGQNRWYKAVGSGMSLFETDPIQINYQPRDLMPYRPADIRRAVAGGDVTVTWKRRTRFTATLKDGTGVVSLNEGAEAYEAYVLAAPYSGDLSRQDAPTAYRRKYTLTSPSFTYTAAEQTADGFDVNLDTLHVVIYQLSSVVGRGFPGARSIESWQDF
ncbi:gene transfer agent host specificity protein [Caulobacter phage Ccr32]|uniref:Tail protein n=4 Tax=Viruses TaxID=10239 RepID=K4JPL1_9CAUD|nr:tail protein [Caulobacter phage phiCbK]AFU86931.1 putative tail protein [Caulobacter phage phiCbK]ARB15014.1 gene transfer agent host specificity protein [Caulobacter phage Ccr32]